MKTRVPRRFLMMSLLVASFAGGCATASREPLNYNLHKQALIQYHDGGAFDADVQRVADRAMAFIRQRAAGQANLAIVLDIDDTVLSTWGRIVSDDFAKNDTLFVRYFSVNSAPAIRPMLELYRESKRLGVKVYFVTGRRASSLATQTEANLKAEGFVDYDGIYFRPEPDPNASAVPAKTAARRSIEAKGLTIIANIGDQQSDLDGGVSERTFKLPNPFYLSP